MQNRASKLNLVNLSIIESEMMHQCERMTVELNPGNFSSSNFDLQK